MIIKVLVYFIIFTLGFIFIALLEWPMWTFILLVFTVFLIILGHMLYIVYGTRNMKKVEKFLLNHSQEPLYNFTYVFAKGTEQEQIAALDEIIRKYQRSYIRDYYCAFREVLFGNFEKALEFAANIEKEPYKNFMKSYIYTKMGNVEEAEKLASSITKVYIKEEILALIAKMKNNHEQFEIHKQKAIESSRGIQRYNIVHSFERL